MKSPVRVRWMVCCRNYQFTQLFIPRVTLWKTRITIVYVKGDNSKSRGNKVDIQFSLTLSVKIAYPILQCTGTFVTCRLYQFISAYIHHRAYTEIGGEVTNGDRDNKELIQSH